MGGRDRDAGDGGRGERAEMDAARIPLPPMPGWRLSDFGRFLNWGRGSAAARARIGAPDLTPTYLRSSGLDQQLATQWAEFYRQVAAANPGNPSAAGRADLMAWIAGLLRETDAERSADVEDR